jgi:hypothetical protein
VSMFKTKIVPGDDDDESKAEDVITMEFLFSLMQIELKAIQSLVCSATLRISLRVQVECS